MVLGETYAPTHVPNYRILHISCVHNIHNMRSYKAHAENGRFPKQPTPRSRHNSRFRIPSQKSLQNQCVLQHKDIESCLCIEISKSSNHTFCPTPRSEKDGNASLSLLSHWFETKTQALCTCCPLHTSSMVLKFPSTHVLK